jgi:hypothetical protein
MGCAFTFSIIISCVEAYFSPILLQFLWKVLWKLFTFYLNFDITLVAYVKLIKKWD